MPPAQKKKCESLKRYSNVLLSLTRPGCRLRGRHGTESRRTQESLAVDRRQRKADSTACSMHVQLWCWPRALEGKRAKSQQARLVYSAHHRSRQTSVDCADRGGDSHGRRVSARTRANCKQNSVWSTSAVVRSLVLQAPITPHSHAPTLVKFLGFVNLHTALTSEPPSATCDVLRLWATDGVTYSTPYRQHPIYVYDVEGRHALVWSATWIRPIGARAHWVRTPPSKSQTAAQRQTRRKHLVLARLNSKIVNDPMTNYW